MTKPAQPPSHRPPRISAIALGTVIAAMAAAVSQPVVSHAAGPPNKLFKKGFNLCRAASLDAIRTAGGQHYRAGIFSAGVCSWARSDLRAGIALSTHPRGVGAILMHDFLAQNGKSGLKARSVTIAGASRAVLVTLPTQRNLHQVAKDLFATYRGGTIQINMTAPRSLPTSRLIAVMKLIAHT